MVALPDTVDHTPRLQARPARQAFAALSASLRFMGVVMILSAVGIWLVPVTAGDGAMVLMKLLVSLLFGCMGAVIVQWGRDGRTDEIHIDTGAGELRHVSRSCDGGMRLRARYRLDELSDIRLQDGKLTVLGQGGAALVQLSAESVEDIGAIRAALMRTPARVS
ncbi:hypothetical protein M8756_01845 [Lutimaribacter sp. EGI FJ00015]|uniref:Uncharacterized protein n=1 Tax=Lutimaribacter degradans TaxID=2945989 RepID=A0ACC5ZRW4_9RHOB|nr:hypothetical protein [Lutimaribacter sp. EGI FJ00013]MCM2561017.1 hypothetical protein [Lutimaribacter sp. EGI FJ00013]MCO0612036.1 hypothetical protein [Lutimaribacter sp. EGI FJ00015]MCO0634844.1 hypothetical protein [Lutimaribacter sp. EGI FJ00014]